MKKMKILFAEDELSLATILIQLLTNKFSTNIEVDWKLDGSLAFDQFKKKNYDLVVSDFQMPNKDGLWLAQQIRDIDKSIPIILWTGSPTIPEPGKELFNEILSKNFHQLINSIDKIYKEKDGK